MMGGGVIPREVALAAGTAALIIISIQMKLIAVKQFFYSF
jgi:hypothetical protein